MVKTESSPAEDAVLQPYITALGALTVWWASLENTLLQVAERLAEVDEITAECLLDQVKGAGSRAAIVKKLALRPNAPFDAWQDCVVDLCDLIAISWAPDRNRLIHDDWTLNELAVSRIRPGKKVGKLEPGDRKTLLPLPPSELTHWEIYDLTEKVMHASIHLLFLSLGFKIWRQKGTLPDVPPQAIWLSKDNIPALFAGQAQEDKQRPM